MTTSINVYVPNRLGSYNVKVQGIASSFPYLNRWIPPQPAGVHSLSSFRVMHYTFKYAIKT